MQCLLCELTLNGNSRQLRHLFDDVLIARTRASWLAIVHGERPDDLTLRREYRSGPTSTQRMGQRQVAIACPQRIGLDVRDDHLFSSVRSCAARPGGWPNGCAVDRIRIGFRK